MGVFCWEKSPCRGLTLHTRSNSPSGRTSAHLLLIYEGHHHGRVRLRCHPRNWLPHHLDVTSSNSSSKGAGHHYCIVTDIEIIPSQMEVAPLHCTVDITQKRSLSKNTKKLKICKRDSQALIVGHRTSVFAPSARRMLQN